MVVPDKASLPTGLLWRVGVKLWQGSDGWLDEDLVAALRVADFVYERGYVGGAGSGDLVSCGGGTWVVRGAAAWSRSRRVSWMMGSGVASSYVSLLRLRKSTQNRGCPFFFLTTTTGDE